MEQDTQRLRMLINDLESRSTDILITAHIGEDVKATIRDFLIVSKALESAIQQMESQSSDVRMAKRKLDAGKKEIEESRKQLQATEKKLNNIRLDTVPQIAGMLRFLLQENLVIAEQFKNEKLISNATKKIKDKVQEALGLLSEI